MADTRSGALNAVVTGGSKGIGKAIAKALVARGDRVAIIARDPLEVGEATYEIAEAGPGICVGLVGDLRFPQVCQELMEGAGDALGGLDLLVNNAGVGRFAPIHELSPEDWDLQLRTNLDAVYHCSRHAIPYLRKGGGWIINIGSLAGKNPFAGGAAYNASKFGLLGLSEAMMLDLRHLGIRVSCVMPGSVNTYFNGSEPDPAAGWKLTPEDVARVVVDLLDFPERALPSRIEIRPTRPPK